MNKVLRAHVPAAIYSTRRCIEDGDGCSIDTVSAHYSPTCRISSQYVYIHLLAVDNFAEVYPVKTAHSPPLPVHLCRTALARAYVLLFSAKLRVTCFWHPDGQTDKSDTTDLATRPRLLRYRYLSPLSRHV